MSLGVVAVVAVAAVIAVVLALLDNPKQVQLPSAEGVEPQQSARRYAYFDNQRDELSRDNIKVTVVHQGHPDDGEGGGTFRNPHLPEREG